MWSVLQRKTEMDFISILYTFEEKFPNYQDNVLFSCCTSFDSPYLPPWPITEFVNDSAFLGDQYRWSLGNSWTGSPKTFDFSVLCFLYLLSQYLTRKVSWKCFESGLGTARKFANGRSTTETIIVLYLSSFHCWLNAIPVGSTASCFTNSTVTCEPFLFLASLN